MGQSLSKLYVHIIFHTKHNQNLIGADIEAELFAYIGYAGYSISPSVVARVERYIDNQKEHHKVVSFQDEYNVDYDENYIST